jgi:hypothetical protein
MGIGTIVDGGGGSWCKSKLESDSESDDVGAKIVSLSLSSTFSESFLPLSPFLEEFYMLLLTPPLCLLSALFLITLSNNDGLL